MLALAVALFSASPVSEASFAASFTSSAKESTAAPASFSLAAATCSLMSASTATWERKSVLRFAMLVHKLPAKRRQTSARIMEVAAIETRVNHGVECFAEAHKVAQRQLQLEPQWLRRLSIESKHLGLVCRSGTAEAAGGMHGRAKTSRSKTTSTHGCWIQLEAPKGSNCF
eukprot:3224136-Amphidinium_carterae.1